MRNLQKRPSGHGSIFDLMFAQSVGAIEDVEAFRSARQATGHPCGA